MDHVSTEKQICMAGEKTKYYMNRKTDQTF